MKKLYASSNDDLQVKALGLHHDHCYHLYWGLTKNAPKEYNVDIKKGKYILIYKED